MKKSQTKSKSPVKAAKPSPQKTTGLSLKAAKKTLKKPSNPKAEKKKEVGAKTSATRPKLPARARTTPIAAVKAPAKKTITGKATKPAVKPGDKKPLRAVNKTQAKLAVPKTKAKLAAATPAAKTKKPKAPAIRKTVTDKSAVKKSVKSSGKMKTIEKTVRETPKTGVRKPLTPGKKSEIKAPAKAVAPIVKITKKTSGKAISTKKPSAEKAQKVVARKSEGKTVKNIKVAVSAEDSAKTKKSILKQKPVPEKKPLIAKTAQGIKAPAKQKGTLKPIEKEKTVKSIKVAVSAEGSAKTKKSILKKQKPVPEKKPLIAKTVPEIKAPAKQKGTLKPVKKERAALSPRGKAVRLEGTFPAATEATKELFAGTGLNIPAAASVTTSVASSHAEKKQKKSAQLKVFLPEEELLPEETQVAPSPKLPEEFGDNELLLMEVDPAIVFVSWEIKPDCISCKTGKLTLRVYDVTGVDFDDSNANSFFDITLGKRVDSRFIDIKMSGRDVIMEIGLLQPDGSFEAIKRSNQVSMPALRTLDELGIASSWTEAETLIGY